MMPTNYALHYIATFQFYLPCNERDCRSLFTYKMKLMDMSCIELWYGSWSENYGWLNFFNISTFLTGSV